MFRRGEPGVARAWLAAVLVLGLALGIAQQMRGAHFMSHTLWTGWLCWAAASACEAARVALRQRRSFQAKSASGAYP